MPTQPHIAVYTDHAQRRIVNTPNTLAALAAELCGIDSTDAMVDPITKTLIVRPSVLDPDWYTSNAGIYAKPSKASGYEVKTSTRWTEPEVFEGAGTFLQCDDPSGGEYARTQTAPGLNRGVYLLYFAYSAGDRTPILECGWSNSATPSAETADIGFKFWSDGLAQLYISGDLVADGKVSGSKSGAATQNEVVSVVILPGRRRELIVFSSAGDGFSYVFETIDEDDAAPVITPDATKFFVVPGSADSNIQVQFGALVFPSTAVAVSNTYNFGVPPSASQTLFDGWFNPVFSGITSASIYGDTAFAGSVDVTSATLRNEDNSGAFVNDGVETAARTRLELSSDGSYPPFIYGAMFEYTFRAEDTDESEQTEISEYIASVDLTVPDDPFGTVASVDLFMGRENEDDEIVRLTDEVPNIDTQSYRPISFEFSDAGISTIRILDAFVKQPKYVDSIRDRTARLRLECYELAKLVEEYQFTSRVPFDGMPLSRPQPAFSAIGYVLGRCGIKPEQMRLSDLGYIISETPSRDGDEWNVVAEVGETGRDVLEKLHRLAADCVYGSHPGIDGPEFWFLDPDDLSPDPVIRLFRNEDDAALFLPSVTGEDLLRYLYHSFNEETLSFEANIVRATGVDPRTLNLIQSYAIDDASIDPSVPPSARPDNWSGFPLHVGAASRQFRRQIDTDRAVEALLPVVTEVGKVGEFSANTMLVYDATGSGDYLPVWRMDLVELDGIGERRVTSLTSNWRKDIPTGRRGEGVTRSATYTVGTVRGSGGTSVESIQRYQKMKLQQRGYIDLLRMGIVAGTPKSVQKVTP